MHENPEDPSSLSSPIRWVLPDQPGSASAFCSSHCNMALCLISSSSLSGLRAHKGQMSYPVSGLMSAMCGGQSRDTCQLQVIKWSLESGSVGTGLPLSSFSRVALVSPTTLVLILKVDVFQQNPLTNLDYSMLPVLHVDLNTRQKKITKCP